MKKGIFLAFLGVGLFSATMAFAQTTVVQASTPLYVAPGCPTITGYLYRGLSDYYTAGQVTQLQQFLAARGYYQPVTGYFGVTTAANVAAFQREQGVYPITGGVGPLTRAAINRACGGGSGPGPVTTTFSASPTNGTAPLDVSFSVGELPANTNMAAVYVDFGDGQQANAQTIYCFRAPCLPTMTSQHTYTTSGMYTAKLMVNNNYCAPQMYCTLIYRAPTQLGSVTINVSSQTTGALNVTSPTAGQNVARGSQLPITWSYPVTPGIGGTAMIVDLYTSAGSKVGTIAISSDTNGSFTWSVPPFPNMYACTLQYPNGLCGTNLQGQYYVQVTATQGNGFESNSTILATGKSGVFTIY